VANFLSYTIGANNTPAAFNNSLIHRSVPGFIIQGGGYYVLNNSLTAIPLDRDYNPASTAHPNGNPLLGEPGISNTRGTIAMALSSGPDSATDSWFFNEVDNSSTLDGTNDGGPFTVFGAVANTSSLAIMDEISSVPVFSPPDDSPFISPADYEADPTPGGPSPDDFAFGRIPLLNYTLGDDANPNPVSVSNLVLVNSITTLTVQDFATWQSANFQGLPAGSSVPSAMPQNDGVPNLLKYFCGVNPNHPITTADRAKLPTVGQTTFGGTTYVTLTYHQSSQQIGVTMNVQTSPDLQTWTTLATPTIIQTGTDSTTTPPDPIYQVQVPVSGTHQFIRLSVSQP
jgi:cyclophilin family peptidyl-prolyl cis-trans isomerase